MMISAPAAPESAPLSVRCLHGKELAHRLPYLETQAVGGTATPLSRHPRWLLVLEQGLRQQPYLLEVRDGERVTAGCLWPSSAVSCSAAISSACPT